jgi:phage terminase large subunit-like protein
MIWTKWDDGDPDDWRVPRAEVKAGMTHVFATFRVARAYADPPDWRNECDDWSAEFGEETFLIFETRMATRMCPALDRFKTSVKAGELTHDGNPAMAEHVGNAKPVRRPGGLIAITKPSQDRKIDTAVTASLAVEARADHLRKEASGPSNSFSAYD